jgi:hypothetical protein
MKKTMWIQTTYPNDKNQYQPAYSPVSLNIVVCSSSIVPVNL